MRQKLEKCDICEKEFADYKLKQHLMIHKEKKFSCAYCDYRNYSQYYVRKHEKLKHLGIKRHWPTQTIRNLTRMFAQCVITRESIIKI